MLGKDFFVAIQARDFGFLSEVELCNFASACLLKSIRESFCVRLNK